MIQHSHQVDTAVQLLLSESLKQFKIQARQEALAERSKYTEQIVPLIEIISTEIIPEIYPFLTDFKKSVIQDQPETGQVVDKAIKKSMDSLFTDDQEPMSTSIPDIQATTTH